MGCCASACLAYWLDLLEKMEGKEAGRRIALVGLALEKTAVFCPDVVPLICGLTHPPLPFSSYQPDILYAH